MTENGRKAVEDMTFFARESKAERESEDHFLSCRRDVLVSKERGRKEESVAELRWRKQACDAYSRQTRKGDSLSRT